MTRGRALALAGVAVAVAAIASIAALGAAWLAPDNVLALWTLVAFCS